jgi:hypothetical protein
MPGRIRSSVSTSADLGEVFEAVALLFLVVARGMAGMLLKSV